MLIAGHIEETNLIAEDADVSIEEATYRRLKPFIGKTIQEISYDVNYPQKSNRQKNFKYHLLLKVLSGDKGIIPELEKAGIEMKTVTVTKSGRPKEHMSFPGFKFMEIINEHWVNSSFYEKIEKKFLLVIFELTEDGHERLIKAGYWNMPYNDRNEARRVWEETKRRVAINAKDLPKASESYVSHVRPKARNSKDKIPTPQGEMHVRQCFWLNQNYLHKVINEQLEQRWAH